MTKDEIKKALQCCMTGTIGDCLNCPYYDDEGFECRIMRDVYQLIIEQEQEIERLRNEKWDAQDDLDCYHSEMKNEIKQAKIEVLERVKSMMYESVHKGVKHRQGVFSESDIDELIEEVKE